MRVESQRWRANFQCRPSLWYKWEFSQSSNFSNWWRVWKIKQFIIVIYKLCAIIHFSIVIVVMWMTFFSTDLHFPIFIWTFISFLDFYFPFSQNRDLILDFFQVFFWTLTIPKRNQRNILVVGIWVLVTGWCNEKT